MVSQSDTLNGVLSVEPILNCWFYLGLYRKEHVSQTTYWLYSLMLHIPFTYLYGMSILFSPFDMSDLNMVTKLLYTNITIVIYIVKVTVLLINFREVHILIDYVKKNVGQYDLSDLTEMLIISKKIKSSKRIFQYSFILYVVTAFLYAAKPLVHSKELIFNVILPYDSNSSATLFWLTYLGQFLGLLFQVIVNSTIDSFLPSILCTLGGYCDALGYNFSKIDRFIASGTDEQFLKEMALKYTHICKLAKMIQQLYSIIIVGQFSMSLGVLCTTLFQISLAPPQNIINYLSLCFYMLTILIEISVPCYFGDEIYTKSGNLLFSMYACNWMGLKPKLKKHVIILMQFFNCPVQITAGYLVTLKIETVNSIIHKAYSFYAVLRGLTGKVN